LTAEPEKSVTSREKRRGSTAPPVARDARKKRKTERGTELESSESEWEEYHSELWESGEVVVVSATTTSNPEVLPMASPPTSSASVSASSGGRSATPRQKTVAISSSSSREETKVATKATDIPKPQRKQRIPREAKRDSELKKTDLRSEVFQFPHVSGGSSSMGSRNHLPGVISCPNKRWKAVVEVR
jgi:hypothetical protein